MIIKSHKVYSVAIWMFWFVGFITGSYIVYMFYKEQDTSILGAFAILISAFLASVTMARSFNQTKEEHELKLRQIKRKAIYATLELMYSVLEPENCPEYTLGNYLELINRVEDSSGILDDESYEKIITIVEQIIVDTRLNPNMFESHLNISIQEFVKNYNNIIDMCLKNNFHTGVYTRIDYWDYLGNKSY